MNLNPSSSPPSVLVVDDDVFSLHAISIALELCGVTDIHTADGGRAGLQWLERLQPPPDILICDVFMPNMDGIEFLSALEKRRYPGGIILVSGGQFDMLEMAQQLGLAGGLKVLGTITKPIFKVPLGKLLGLAKPPTCGHSPTTASTH